MNATLDYMIIGVEKAGTSSLLKHLGKHPEIAIPGKYNHQNGDYRFGQEFSYFLPDSRLSSMSFNDYFRCEFGEIPEGVKFCLAKNVGVCFEIEAMRAFKRNNNSAKVIIVLRNPIDRAYSSYWYQRYRGAETRSSFWEAIQPEMEGRHVNRHLSYLNRGLYYDQVIAAFSVFGKGNVKIILTERMKADPSFVADDVFMFIGVSPISESMDKVNESKTARSKKLASFLYTESFLKRAVRRLFPYEIKKKVLLVLQRINSKPNNNPSLDVSAREMLRRYYQSDIDKLSGIIDCDLSCYWKDFKSGSGLRNE